MFQKTVILLILLAASMPVHAQEPTVPEQAQPLVTLSPEEEKEAKAWLAAMAKWLKKDQAWHNGKIEDRSFRSHKLAPEPPGWMFCFCQESVGPDKEIQQACDLYLATPFDGVTEQIRNQIAQTRADKEKLIKTSFLSRFHFDFSGSQTTFSNKSNSVLGLVGVHVSLMDIGRVQVYGLPGPILVLVPNRYGSRDLRPGYTWGMSVKLGDFHFPSTAGKYNNATFYLNLTKCWVNMDAGNLQTRQALDFVSLSISPRKQH
jgi:hypothetical protein